MLFGSVRYCYVVFDIIMQCYILFGSVRYC